MGLSPDGSPIQYGNAVSPRLAIGQAGHAKGGPYDRILIDGSVEYIPDGIVEQLADGGRLGTALVDRGVARLVIGRKA